MNTTAKRLGDRLYEHLVEHRVLFLLATGLLVYVTFLGLRDVWYPDEPDIAEVARAMYVSGDWVSPRRMGEIWVDYPPMIYWIGTISSHVFGEMSAFSLRFPNALGAIATIVFTALVAGLWFGREAGFWAGFSLATFQLFVYEGNSYRPDVMFTLTIFAGMASYCLGSLRERGLGLRVVAFIFFGLAMLSKGPLGLLLPGLVLVLWLGLDRKWIRILELAPLSLVAIATYGLWFAANAEAMGWENMLGEFYAQNFERFLTSDNRGHGQPWYYYLRNFWMDFSPWSWLFPAALWTLLRSGKWNDRRVRLLVIWFFVFLAFLSLAATKRQLYLLPAFPAAAMLLSIWLADVSSASSDGIVGQRAVRIFSWALVAGFTVLGAFAIWASGNLDLLARNRELNYQEVELMGNLPGPLLALGIVLLLAALVIGSFWKLGGGRSALVGVGLSHIAVYVVILALVFPSFAPVKTYRPQSEWISNAIGDEPRFGMVDESGVPRRGGFSYYTGTAVDLLDGPNEAVDYLRRYPKTIILIRSTQYERDFVQTDVDEALRRIGEIRVGSHRYFVVEPAWIDSGRTPVQL